MECIAAVKQNDEKAVDQQQKSIQKREGGG